MAIKSKSTSYFRGIISLLCLMISICAAVLGAAGLVAVLFDPSLQLTAVEFIEYFRNYSQIPSELLIVPVIILALFVAVVIFAFAFRQDRNMFESAIARVLGKIWVEIKILLISFAILLCMMISGGFATVFIPALICTCILILYFLCLDIGHNKRFFRHNIIRTVLRSINSYGDMTTFQQRSLRRIYSCIAVIICVTVVSGLIFLATVDNSDTAGVAFAAVIFWTMSVVGTVWWYILALKQDLRDWNILMAQIAEMYDGNLDAVNHVPPTSNLYDCAMQLNMIRTGIQKTVEDAIKADRTKVELITNVSHDLKTPLTSIISYVELLKREPDLPPHVMDYINTISHKADRLNHMVQDVFDVSKAATGNINLDMEELDIGKLLQQTFAEMDETIKSTQLTWRVEIPEIPILVYADGQRLYRVFQNLIRNCAQYSLDGSRAYVNLTVKGGFATVSIRNISRNEITMKGDDLTARFVRGDQNRTSEGSGLGLSIAKSFTEACGGHFTVHTDGDLFTVTVQFPQVMRPQSTVAPPAQE